MSFLEKTIQDGTLAISIFAIVLYFSIFTVIFILPANFLFCWGWKKLQKTRISALALAVLNIFFVGAYVFLLWYWNYEPNPLRKYGFEYVLEPSGDRMDYPGKSITMWIETPQGKITGLFYDGEYLTVAFKDMDGDGVDDIVLQAHHNPYQSTIIKLIVKDGKATGFKIVHDDLNPPI